MKSILCRWYPDGSICWPCWNGSEIEWRRRVDLGGGKKKWVDEPEPPQARGKVTPDGLLIRACFWNDDGTCPDPTGRSSEKVGVPTCTDATTVRFFNDRHRRKTPAELQRDVEHWLRESGAELVRVSVARCVLMDSPEDLMPQECEAARECLSGLDEIHECGECATESTGWNVQRYFGSATDER